MRITQLYIKDSKCSKEYAYCEDRNRNHRTEMEDNFVIEDQIIDNNSGLFAILDGHGGSQISDFCAKNLVNIFKEEYSKQSDDIKSLFKSICKRIDVQISTLNASQTGTTCCLAYLRKFNQKKYCHIANLGDTRAIICTDKLIAKRVSIDHKVSNPSEVDRIRSEGGTIIKGRVAGQLAITRALGDLELKPYGVSNIPDYQEFQIDDKVIYMIIASDGLWDVCEDQQAIELCKPCLNSNQMAKKLVSHAINNGTRDNTSVMVIRF